jgi:hypothetical protein
MFLLHLQVKHPITNDVRTQQWRFDPATLNAPRMAALRDKIITWCTEMDAADTSAATTETL